MNESSPPLAALRAQVAALDGAKLSDSRRFVLGVESLDHRLGGGLPRARLHEMFAASTEDRGALAGLALMLAICVGQGPLLWIRQESGVRAVGRLYGPGLAELGLDPARLVEIVAPDEAGLLRAAGDAVRCPALSAVLIEPMGARGLDLTSSRRLAVAAEKSGVTILLLHGVAEPGPSAAYSRWRVRSRGSARLDAGAPGHPAMELELLRHRGGVPGLRICLEWNRDELAFREAALSGAPFSLPADGPAGAPDRDRGGGDRLSA